MYDFGVCTWMGYNATICMCHAKQTNATLVGVFLGCYSSVFEETLSPAGSCWGSHSFELDAYFATLQSTGKRSALGTAREAELYGGVLSSSLVST